MNVEEFSGIDQEPGRKKSQAFQGEAVKFIEEFSDDDGAPQRGNLLQEQLPDGDRSKESVHI